jgi:O-antigen/teichoic acid export membrane protein
VLTSSPAAPLVKRWAADGTASLVIGTAVATVGNYVYQVIGGRALGPVDFAPVSSLLTISFLAFAVVLLPVEQLVIRSTIWREGFRRSARPAAGIAALLATAVSVLAAALGREQFFGGDGRFVLLVGLSVATHGVYVVGRGRLAGLRRYRSYGLATGGMSLLRLGLAALLLAAGAGAVGFAGALAVAPFVILLWWGTIKPGSRAPGEGTQSPAAFLFSFVLAAGASQLLLMSGPLVAAVLGAGASGISVIYVTLTIARSPLLLGYSLLARVLPPFTSLAKLGHQAELDRWVRRIAVAGLLGALPALALGAWIGPVIVELLFGSAFRPGTAFAALTAAGVTLGGAAMFLGQILVARADTGRLAVAWLAAVAAAAAVLVMMTSTVENRIGAAFMTGELVALIATALLGLGRRPYEASSAADTALQ